MGLNWKGEEGGRRGERARGNGRRQEEVIKLRVMWDGELERVRGMERKTGAGERGDGWGEGEGRE